MAPHAFLFPNQWLTVERAVAEGGRRARRCRCSVTGAVGGGALALSLGLLTQMARVNLSKILAEGSAKGCRHTTALCGPC